MMDANDFDYASIMNAADAKLHAIGFDRLNDPERVVALFSVGRFEISMGGLDSFYYSYFGGYAVELVWALEQIGAVKAADVLRRANALFPGGVPPHDSDERYDALVAIRNQDEDPLETLTGEFYDASNAEDLESSIAKYIAAHRDDLPTRWP